MTVKRSLRDESLQEITIRKYESPHGQPSGEVSRRFLLSVGLLQPGDSRDILVDVFNLLLAARKSQKYLPMAELLQRLEGKPGASAPNIRRQLRRLKDLKLVEKTQHGYRITEFGKVSTVVDNYIVPYVINQSVERMREYSKALD